MATPSNFRYEIFVTNAVTSMATALAVFDLTYVNDPSFIITETREKGKMYFVRKIKNKIIVEKDDYQYFLANISNCYKYWVNIYKFCQGEEVFITRAYFSYKDIMFDLDKCFCEIELSDSSIYSCFNKRKSQVVDVYGATAAPQNLGLFPSPTVFRSIDFGQAVLTITSMMACCDDEVCYYNLISDFFNWQDDGFGGTLLPSNQAATNYVNTLQPNYYLRLGAKSDFLNPAASNPATIVNLTFDDIETIMEEVFNVYWVIEGTKLRFEHYSWFSKNMNYDATSATNFPFNKFKNKVTFNKDELPVSETWEFLDAAGVDFVGVPILYDPSCANGENRERGYDLLTTDVQNIIAGSANNIDGIVLVDATETIPNTAWFVYSVIGYLSTVLTRNARLSIANIQYDLFRHGRPFSSGTVNNALTNFFSKEPDILQDNIIVENCCNDTFEKNQSFVRTELGDGIIDEAEIDFTKEIIKFKLRHDSI